VAAITISGAFATSARITGWSDEARFWKDGVAEASRGDCQPLMGLAGLQLDRGQTRLALSTYELALVEARKVPSVPASVARRRGVMAGIGVALTRLGRREEAIGVYRELQRDQPENDAVRVQLARLLAEDAKPSVQVPNPLPIRSAKLSK
jgi:tetratricopeptide (TPR) repeat protein